jgi:hypothetical protein
MNDYLVEHPNAMPAREAAMTYLFSETAPVLRLVTTPPEVYAEAVHDEPEAIGA